MNLPNKLSLLRMGLIPVVMALLLPVDPVCTRIAAVVYGIAAFTDFLDGYIARKQHIVTDFGKFIDPVADKLLNLSALIMLSHQGLLPAWAVVVILARELLVDGLRMVAVGQGRVIAAGKLGKIKTVSQIALILWLMLSLQPATQPVSLALIAWVIVITLWSGADYLWKNRDCIRNA